MCCRDITFLKQKQRGIDGQGKECEDTVPLPDTQKGRPKQTLLKKGDDGSDETTETEDSLGGGSGSEALHAGGGDKSSDEGMESSNNEEANKEAMLSKVHRGYRKPLAAQRVRNRLGKKKTRNGHGGTQKKQRMSEKGQGKT